MKEEKGNKNFTYLIIGLCVLFLIILIVCCVVFFNRKEEVVNKNKKGGEVTLSYTDDLNVFSITNAVPTTDAVAMVSNGADTYFDFSVNTEIYEANKIDYEIYVEKYGNTPTISDNDIKIYLEKQNSGTFESVFEPSAFEPLKAKSELGTPRGAMVIYKDSANNDLTENYRLRMWLSDTAIVNPGTIPSYTIKVSVIGKSK